MDAMPPCSPPPCVIEAAARYSLPPLLVEAVRQVEGGKAGQRKKNKDGSIDHGHMQINTFWTTKFSELYGVKADAIATNACLNYNAGAFVLRYEINRAGGNFWKGVGRYHSPNPLLAREYIVRVYDAAERLRSRACG